MHTDCRWLNVFEKHTELWLQVVKCYLRRLIIGVCVYILYMYVFINNSEGKGIFHTRTDHESPEWEPTYSCTVF